MNIGIILTGGNGSRMKSSLPKQFIKVNGKEIFIYTIEKFSSCQEIDKIVLVINKEYEDMYRDILKHHSLNDIDLIYGGSTRQESVYNALKGIKCNNDDIILIHDGARPLVNHKIILNNINSIKKDGKPVSTIISFVDTIIDKDYNLFNRDGLYGVQTPQTFLYGDILKIHTLAREENGNASDDVQLAKKYHYEFNLVEGSRTNIKITKQEDLDLFMKLM